MTHDNKTRRTYGYERHQSLWDVLKAIVRRQPIVDCACWDCRMARHHGH